MSATIGAPTRAGWRKAVKESSDPSSAPGAGSVEQPQEGSLRALVSVPYLLLIAAILGGGLLGLLLVNNSLAAGSFQQASLNAEQVALFEKEQALRQEVQRLSSPTLLRSTARKMDMVPAANTAYLNIRNGRILGIPMVAGSAKVTVGLPGSNDAEEPVAAVSDPEATAAADPAADPGPEAAAGADGTPQSGEVGAGLPGASTDGAATENSAPAPSVGTGDGAAVGEEDPLSAYDRAVVSGGVG